MINPTGNRCYAGLPTLMNHRPYDRHGKTLRGSKKSVLLYTTDCGDDKEDFGLKIQQRSISLTALHTGSSNIQQQQFLEPRMAQLETLEAKMASIEVSLSTTPRRKKGGSITGVTSSPAGHRARDVGKELDALRIALRDKENIIQNLKGQLCNTLSNRLSLRNGPSLTESDRKAAEDRLQRLRRDADNKRLAIKNLKLALERLDITDNIDVRIQQAELEYRLGREELELLTLREESRALQAALELADTQEKQKNHTIFSCISGSTQVTVHALEVSADPKSPRFGAGPRDDAPGLYVDWAVEDSGLCKGDRQHDIICIYGLVQDISHGFYQPKEQRIILAVGFPENRCSVAWIESTGSPPCGSTNCSVCLTFARPRPQPGITILEVNGKLVVGAGRSDLARLLAVAPDSAQIVVLRKGESLAALRTLRSDNLRLTHRIGYLEEQVRDLLTPSRPPAPAEPPPNRQEQVQVFQKGPQVTALVANLPGLSVKSPAELRQSLPTVRTRHGDHQRRVNESRNSKDSDFASDGTTANHHHHKSKTRQRPQGYQLARSTASLDCKQSHSQIQRRPLRAESAMEQVHKSRRNAPSLQSLEFDSEPTYYRLQDSQSRTSEHSDVSMMYSNSHELRTRPTPPKKPLRLSLHRAASLQSVESAPPTPQHDISSRKPVKRNYRGDPPIGLERGELSQHNSDRNSDTIQTSQNNNQAPQPPPRTPSRAESCQSALRWPSPRPRPQLASVPMEKWC